MNKSFKKKSLFIIQWQQNKNTKQLVKDTTLAAIAKLRFCF